MDVVEGVDFLADGTMHDLWCGMGFEGGTNFMLLWGEHAGGCESLPVHLNLLVAVA